MTMTITLSSVSSTGEDQHFPSKFVGPSPKHCQVIKLLSTKGPGDIEFCPQDHLLVGTNMSTKFEGPNHKHCRIISLFDTKGQVTLTFDLKVTYSSGPSSLFFGSPRLNHCQWSFALCKTSDPSPHPHLHPHSWRGPLFTPGS